MIKQAKLVRVEELMKLIEIEELVELIGLEELTRPLDVKELVKLVELAELEKLEEKETDLLLLIELESRKLEQLRLKPRELLKL